MADLRLAELIAPLSRVTDLGLGAPPETAIRTCLVATGLARRVACDEREHSAIYYTALLQHIGCTAYAHETAALVGGDDIAFHAAGGRLGDGNVRETLTFLRTGIARDASPLHRARAVFNVVRAGPAEVEQLFRADCEVAVRTADRLGLPASVQHGLETVYARWDGKGTPSIRGEEIALAARFALVAIQAVVFHHIGGADLAIETIRRRAGGALDPTIAEAFVHHGSSLLSEIDAVDALPAVLDVEPEPHHHITEPRLDTVARAFADVADLKSPWYHGHAPGVAVLVERAALICGLPAHEVAHVRRAGLLHDLGRVGLPNGILDKPGPLTTTEWEQVRLHPYYSERILSRSPVLAPLATLAGMHHERLDGTGYHRQATATSISIEARLLATANRYQALTEERAYRDALPPERAATELQADANLGRLDPEAVHAVLEAAGHIPERTQRRWPAGLTDREVQVLQLAARGLSKKEIGATLFISPKTADHHIQHIYAKIGVSTRAGAAIFAMQHDLVQTHLA